MADDKDIMRLLKIQARALKNIEDVARALVAEVNSQKNFIRRMLADIRQAEEHEEENEVPLESSELPSNVLPFAVERDQED